MLITKIKLKNWRNFKDAEATKTNGVYEVRTGDGVPGGIFESWFYLSSAIDRDGETNIKVATKMTKSTKADLLQSVYFLPKKTKA